MALADRRVLLRLVLLVLSAYLLTMAGRLTSGDGETVFQTTRALIERRQLSIPPRPETAIGRGGRSYGKYGLGQSIAQAPFVVAGKFAGNLFGATDDRPERFLTGMTNSAVSAALVALFWLLCRRLGAGTRAATGASLVLAFSTVIWPYARADFSEPAQALTLLATFYALLRWRSSPRPWWLMAAGTAAGFAFLTKAAAIIVLPPMALYLAFALWEQRAQGWRALLP
jgi:hypothetical protein